MKHFAVIDWIVFIVYASVIVFVGLWVSRRKKGNKKHPRTISLQGAHCPGGQSVPLCSQQIFPQNISLPCRGQDMQ